MRVLFVTRGLAPDDLSESGRLAAATLADLRRHHPVEVVAGYVRGRRLVPAEALGVDLCGRGPVQAAWALRRATWSRARSVGPDVVVSTSLEAPRCGRPAWAVLGRAVDMEAGVIGRAALVRLAAYAGVLVPDDAVKDALVAQGAQAERIRVCPPGVRPVVRRRGDAEQVRVVGLGPIGPVHGQHLLIDAVARLAPVEKARVRLELAGHIEDPVYLGHLRVQAHGQPVRLQADPDPDTLTDLLAGADLLAHMPLQPDAWPFDAIRAAVSGIPVLVADHARLTRLLAPAARALPPGDVPVLRDALRAHLDDPDALDTRAAETREDLAARLAREATARRLADLLAGGP